MKRLILTAALLLMALGVMVAPAAAQDDSHVLAGNFPDETAFYLEFRTDDAQLEMLDELIARISSAAGMMGAQGLTEMLDESLDRMDDGATFANAVRPWLGDTAALGILRVDEEALSAPTPPMLIAVEITDAALAEKFFTVNAPLGEYTIERGEGVTTYLPPAGGGNNPFLIFQSDVLIIGVTPSDTAWTGAALSENPDFTGALDLLPEESYSASLYIDSPAFLEAVMSESGGMSSTEMAMITPMMNAVKPQAMGITMVDDSIILDVASPVDLEALSAFGMVSSDAIDPAFAARIPANTPLVVHGTNLYLSYQSGLQSLEALSEMMAESSSGDFSAQDMETALFGLNFLVRDLTGLEVDEAIGWMTGDYAFALSLTPAFADSNSLMAAMGALPFDFGVVIEATDADAAQTLYDGLSRSLSSFAADELTVTEELLFNDVSALVFTISTPDVPFPIELLAATGNDVFAFGTRRMVSAAIDPTNGLDTDERFNAASAYFLDGANSVFYFNAEGLQPIVRMLLNEENGRAFQRDAQQIGLALTMANMVSASGAVLTEESASLARMVWTLPE